MKRPGLSGFWEAAVPACCSRQARFGASKCPPEYPWTGKTATGAVITPDELIRILANRNQGPAAAGIEEKKADRMAVDLTRANLSGVNLTGADLFRPNLYGANLKESDLSGAYLFDANLNGANLTKANLQDAVLYRPNLRGPGSTGCSRKNTPSGPPAGSGPWPGSNPCSAPSFWFSGPFSWFWASLSSEQ